VTLKLGLCGALPPAPTGPADYLAGLLPELTRRADITCFVAEPADVAEEILARFDVRPLSERGTGVDLVFYHLANNDVQMPYDFAAREGPPGVAVLHDGSLHHLMSEKLLDEDNADDYAAFLTQAHGERGAALADVRATGIRGSVELFVFDLLRCFLADQLAVVVHSDYARRLVELRVPGLPVSVLPHYSIGSSPGLSRSDLELPADRVCIGHLGFLTPEKRPEVLLRAFAELRRRGVDAYLVFAGGDYTSGHILDDIAALGLAEDVRVTGFIGADELDAYAAVLDIVVSLRWPHIGETSGSLMRALRAGRPVVVQELGTWAELPADAVYRISGGNGTVRNLSLALRELALDQTLRRRIGRAGRAYAQSVGDASDAADRYVAIARAVLSRPRTTPAEALREHKQDVAEAIDRGAPAWLRAIPPAPLEGRLLDLGSPAGVRRLLSSAWGYDVSTCGPRTDRFPFETGSVDVVLCSQLVPELLAEANRVLRPDGLLVAAAGAMGAEVALRRNGFSLMTAEDTSTLAARKVSLPAPSRAG
jgi:glycosyltransferase involved in cell wall biosynthesis